MTGYQKASLLSFPPADQATEAPETPPETPASVLFSVPATVRRQRHGPPAHIIPLRSFIHQLMREGGIFSKPDTLTNRAATVCDLAVPTGYLAGVFDVNGVMKASLDPTPMLARQIARVS